MKKPLVFISYASEELKLADFIKDFLLRVSDNKIEIFVAKRDIASGADPLKTMLEEKLKNADAIVPICSTKSKETPWLWWESASVWATTGKVHPLFTNISANAFGGPLTLVVQGKDCFIKKEFYETMQMLFKNLEIATTLLDFTKEEEGRYEELKRYNFKNAELASVNISYKVIEQNQELHKYSLIFEIQNKAEAAFEDVILELLFPTIYMVRNDWNYPWLIQSIPKDKPDYTCLTFIFNNIPENAKKKFTQYLLPGKTLKIFGVDDDSMTNLVYEVDSYRWRDRNKHNVSYKLYINRRAPQAGEIPFSSLQIF